ncbi:hypothetical protein DL95DRAFT_490636 [Leptodontidium sp. 2 PMI_412]|nr:hypothetical protein DL95DRAFT_490636 [Leptodontidium sp. 2 PMI_412]
MSFLPLLLPLYSLLYSSFLPSPPLPSPSLPGWLIQNSMGRGNKWLQAYRAVASPYTSGVGAVEVEVEVGCRYPDVPHSPTPLSPFTFHPSLRQTNLTIGFRSAASNFLSSSPVPDEPPSINLPQLPKTLRIADLQEHNQETPVLYSTPPHEPTNTERLTLPCRFAYVYAAAATPPAELAVATDIASQE